MEVDVLRVRESMRVARIPIERFSYVKMTEGVYRSIKRRDYRVL